MELVHSYLIFYNKITIFYDFLHFLCFLKLFPLKFSLPPDPGGKMNADPDPQPCLEVAEPLRDLPELEAGVAYAVQPLVVLLRDFALSESKPMICCATDQELNPLRK